MKFFSDKPSDPTLDHETASPTKYHRSVDYGGQKMPTPSLSAKEERIYNSLKRMQYWMDDSIPICCTGGRRMGIDPLIGLLPVVGGLWLQPYQSLVRRPRRTAHESIHARQNANQCVD